MKYIKLFEKNIKPEEKEGNKVARHIQRLINKFLGLSKNIDNVQVVHDIFWNSKKYNFNPYLMIKMKQWKDIPKIQIIINELVRLGCEDNPPAKHQVPYNDRDNRVFLLTKQQIEELIISFKNGLPFIEMNKKSIFHDQLYTYKKLKFKNYTHDKDIVVGKLEAGVLSHDINIKIIGLSLSEEEEEFILKSQWNDDMKYVRKATPEEKEFYEEHEIALKYNL